jgi:hypothetical protein
LSGTLRWQFNGDVTSALEHEISEFEMGRVQGLGIFRSSWFPLDLFRYTAAAAGPFSTGPLGHLDFTGGRDGLPTYFGYAAGTIGGANFTEYLGSYQFHNAVNASSVFDKGDFVDWENSGFAYDAFGGNAIGYPNTVSDTDLEVMRVLGWTRWHAPTPTIALAPSSDSGVKGDGVTNLATQVITGTGEPGDSIVLSDTYYFVVTGGSPPTPGVIATGVVAPDGTWSITTHLSAVGFHSLTATESDLLHGASLASAPLDVAVDPRTPSAPITLQLSTGSDTGTKGDNVTAVTTPVITGVEGSGGSGGDTITVYEGATIVGTGTVGIFGGIWSVTVGPLAIGTHALTAKETAATGNVSATSAALSLTIISSSTVAAARTSANVPVAHAQSVMASSLFIASDADGDTIAQYDFWNSGNGGGHWTVAGVAQGINQDVYVTASQLAQTAYQSGSGADTLWVRASDGSEWSVWSQAFTVMAPVDVGPTLMPVSSNFTPTHRQSLVASSFFTYSDPFGSAATQYDIWASGNGNSYFVLAGGVLAAHQDNVISAAQLGQLSYLTGSGADTFFIRANDGTSWGAWSSFAVVAPVDSGSVVIPAHANLPASHGQSFAASSLFTYGNPFGDTATQYDVWNIGSGGGHFVLAGTPLGANQDNLIAAAQLGQLSYQSGSGTDTLWIRANDGTVWGAWSAGFTVVAPLDTGPVVTPTNGNLTVPHGQSFAASSLFTYSDPFGIAATQYDVRNIGSGGGHFVLAGTPLGANQEDIITAAQLGQLSYQSGSGTDTVWIRANDGTVWGAWSAGFTIAAPIDTGPVVTSVQSMAAEPSQFVSASSLFTTSDPFGDPVELYDFWDTGSGGGSFLLTNQVLAANQDNYVTAGQLPQTMYLPGLGTDTLWVRVNQGGQWSSWSPGFTVSALVPGTAVANPVPTLGVSSVANATSGEVVSLSKLVTIAGASSLVDAGEADSAYAQLELWDSRGTAAGGQFVLDGVAQTGGHEIDVSPDDLTSTVFDAGTAAGTDMLWARLLQNDGTLTAWQPFSVTVPEATLTAVSYPNATPGQQIALSTLLTISDTGHVGYQKLELWDSNGTAAGGEFSIGGVAQTGEHEIDVSSATVAALSQVPGALVFNAGTSGVADTLWARLLQTDGTLTPWQKFAVVDPVTVAEGATAELASAYAGQAIFAGSTGTLQLDNSTGFTGTVAGMTGLDTIDFRDIDFAKAAPATYSGNSSGGTLAVSDGTHTANIALLGNYLASTFVASSDGHGGTLVVDPPANTFNPQTPPVLAQSFAA